LVDAASAAICDVGVSRKKGDPAPQGGIAFALALDAG